ncbi:MAG: hypothetical protein R3F61_34165 [Myxococcota bacterium]
MSQELIDRWTVFIEKVSERLDAIIQEAGQGVLAIGRAHREDSMPLNNALTGLDHRVRQLEERIDQVWDDKVEGQFSSVGGKVHDLGIDMTADAKRTHRQRWERAKASWLSTLANEAKPLALAAEAEPVACQNCGAPLALPTRRKTVSHPCGSCGTVNQVVPPAIVRAYFGAGCVNLANAASLPHRHAVEDNRVEVDRWSRARNWAAETVESMETWRDLERKVHQTYAETLASLTGEPIDTGFVESRMKHFMKYGLDMNQAWVKVHGRST